jgi:hypothetical protein
MSMDAAFIPVESTAEVKEDNLETEVVQLKGTVANGGPATKPKSGRPKLFRNKTAPVNDEPIRIPITTSNSKEIGKASAVFRI